jgi:hypothetical protein
MKLWGSDVACYVELDDTRKIICATPMKKPRVQLIEIVEGRRTSLPFTVEDGSLADPAEMAKNSKKKLFLIVLDHFSHKNGPNDLVWGLFLCLDIESYIPPTCGPLSTF